MKECEKTKAFLSSTHCCQQLTTMMRNKKEKNLHTKEERKKRFDLLAFTAFFLVLKVEGRKV
jgi:hypothetical protein